VKISIGNYEMEIIHHDPKIYTIQGVISIEECKYFKEISMDFMKRSTVSAIDHNANKIGSIDKRRTSSNCWVKHDHSETTQLVVNRISELVKMPVKNAESFQVLHYQEKEEYQAHLDAFDKETELGKAFLGNSGQRVLTVLGYLNNVDEGGETHFPNIDKTVIPEEGKIVVFEVCHQDTDMPHKNALHGACPVISGEKWAFNLWYRQYEVDLNY